MDSTEGLVRGQPVADTGAPIMVPVGDECLGRIINVVGEPVDERGPVVSKTHYPIHRPAPAFVDQSTEAQVLITDTEFAPVMREALALLRQGRNLHIDGKLGRVLEIGTGCGYQAALLSVMSKEVYSIERLRGLHEKARDNLRHLRVANLHLLFGDGMAGYAQGAPYAGIIAAAGGEAVPTAWIEQLAVGGRLVAPLVTAQGQQALLVLDKTEQGIQQQWLEAVHFVPLKSGVG